MRWALVAVFAVHNVEEIVTTRGSGPLGPVLAARIGIDPALFRADRFALAAGLLAVAVAAVVLPWRGRRAGPGPRRAGPGRVSLWPLVARRTGLGRAVVVVGVAGALGLNAALHLGRGLATGTTNPGIWSAPVLLASAGFAAVGVVRESGLGPKAAVVAAAAGAMLMVPAIVLALGAAHALLT